MKSPKTSVARLGGSRVRRATGLLEGELAGRMVPIEPREAAKEAVTVSAMRQKIARSVAIVVILL